MTDAWPGWGIPSCAFRLICHVPVGMVSVVGMRLYDAAGNMDQSTFDGIPDGSSFLYGLQIVGQAGTASFVWNTIQYLMSPLWSGRHLGVVGIIDLGLAAALISGITYQHRFLPGSYGECRGAGIWKDGPDGRNFFQVFAANTDQPDAVCRDFVRNWILAVVLVTLYMICGITNIVLGFGGKYIRPPPSKDQPEPKYQPTYPSGIEENNQPEERDLRKVYSYLLIVGCVIVILRHSLAATSFALRYTFKFLASFRMAGAPPKVAEQETTGQHDCLGAPNSTKSQCFVCRARICNLCQKDVGTYEATETFRHLTQCQPWCSRCIYFKSRSYLGPFEHSYYQVPSAVWTTRPMCSLCSAKPSEERNNLREARDKFEARRLAKLPLVCRKCKEPLKSTGPRWWYSPQTKGECHHASHPGWASR